MNAARTRNESSKKTAARRRTGAKSAAKKGSRATARKTSAKGGTARKSSAKGASARKGSAKQAAKRPAKRAATKSRSPIGQSIDMLSEQHREAQALFRKGERARDDAEKFQQVVEQCCNLLTEHDEIEEQYFYPVMRENARDEEMIAEALVEHATAKSLIGQLRDGNPEDERYAATFKVLSEYVKHHVKEEEKEIFPRARRVRADWQPLLDALQSAHERSEQAAMGGSDESMMARTREGMADGRARRGGGTGELLGGSMQETEQGQQGGGQRGRRASARRTSRTRDAGTESTAVGGSEEGGALEQEQDEQTSRGTRSGSR
jgi:hemerythrin superfamily protein